MNKGLRGVIAGIGVSALLTGGIVSASNRSDTVQRFFRNIKITLNSSTITPKDANGKDVEPFIVDGTTYLPVRAVGEAMGFDVDWDNDTSTVVLKNSEKNHREIQIEDEIFSERLTTNTWNGEYQKLNFYVPSNIEMIESEETVVSYQRYLEIIESINNLSKSQFKPYDKQTNYIIYWHMAKDVIENIELVDCEEGDNEITLYGDYTGEGYVPQAGVGVFIAIPTNLPIETPVNYVECLCPSEVEDLMLHGVQGRGKPIIYLYPTEETEVNVKLLKEENLTCSYPKYKGEWKVNAQPDGTLIDRDTGRKLYSLYYESKNEKPFQVEEEGFIVKGEKVANFLEEKLAILGLTEREAEEFIIYWLPKLEANPYNYIRFANEEEIDSGMPWKITPQPDSIIRVLMTYKALEQPIQVQEQILDTPERTGFTIVEWGGTEIKN